MLCVMKNCQASSERFNLHLSVDTSSSTSSWDMVDHRACIRIRSSSSPKSESLSAYSFALVFRDWGMIGITVPQSHIWSDIFLSFLNVTASSSELLLSSALNLHNRHWNRVPFVVQWISGENLRSREDGWCFGSVGLRGLRLHLGVTIRSPSPLGNCPWCVSKSKLKNKVYPTVQVF